MSFISSKTGRGYAPGWFLAHEECTRVTKEIPQEGATATDEGGKYVAMGTVFPANDGTAIGIVYEDVDVTTGDMPGSVVTKGEVYADRLACAGDYTAVTPESGDNPKAKGWYVKDGDEYVATTDTSVQGGTTYYEKGITAAAKAALETAGVKFV